MTTPVRKVLRKALQSLRAPAAKEGGSGFVFFKTHESMRDTDLLSFLACF